MGELLSPENRKDWMQELDSELADLNKQCAALEAEKEKLRERVRLLKDVESHFSETEVTDLARQAQKELEKHKEDLEAVEKLRSEKRSRLKFVRELRKVVAHEPEKERPGT